MSQTRHYKAEQRALRYSLWGVLLFVILGVVFALLTRSEAILFDAAFSFIALCVTVVTIQVAMLVERPCDDVFHFGYSAIEPAMNLLRSLIIVGACLMALVGAIDRITSGGSTTEYWLAVYYGIAATAGCLGTAWLMFRTNKNTSSELVKTEILTWFIDGLLSGIILLGFIAAVLLESNGYEHYARFADSILLIILVILTLPIPLRIVLESSRQLIDMAPRAEVVAQIHRLLRESTVYPSWSGMDVRVSKRGRSIYVLVYVVVEPEQELRDISILDGVREKCLSTLKGWHAWIEMDMVFVGNLKMIPGGRLSILSEAV